LAQPLLLATLKILVALSLLWPRELKTEQLRNSLLIEADDGFAVNKGHRSALVTHVKQLLQCSRIGAHVLVNEIDALLRKKLFLFVARASTGL
jgi:hypothetical protein